MSTLSVQNIIGVVDLSQLANLSLSGFINAASIRANSEPINGWDLLAPVASIGTGTTYTFNNIPPGYHILSIAIGGMQHNSANPAYLLLETSNNNGSTWHTGPDRLSDTFSGGAGNTVTFLKVTNASGNFGAGALIQGEYGNYYWRYSGTKNQIAPTNAMRVSMNAGNFQAGTIALYGMKYNVT